MFNKSNQPISFDSLIEEYQAELAKRGLPQMSADELLHEELSDEDRSYVSGFFNRWSALEEEERCFAEAEREAYAGEAGYNMVERGW